MKLHVYPAGAQAGPASVRDLEAELDGAFLPDSTVTLVSAAPEDRHMGVGLEAVAVVVGSPGLLQLARCFHTYLKNRRRELRVVLSCDDREAELTVVWTGPSPPEVESMVQLLKEWHEHG